MENTSNASFETGRVLVSGLSPAWQQILQFDTFRTGEVNRAQEAQWCASGKVLNAARACRALGAATSLVCPVGGLTGAAIRKEFATLDIDCTWIEMPENTRVCTTILDESTGATTELVGNAGPIPKEVLEDFTNAVRTRAVDADVVLFTGSLPHGTAPQFLADLLGPVDAPLILDVRGRELLESLPLRPLVIKPNREELAATVGRDLDDADDLFNACDELLSGGAQWAVISDGEHALYACSRDCRFILYPPNVSVVNPIGCGDCLAAGIAVATARCMGMADAVRFGMGAAAQNATNLLPARIDAATSTALAEACVVHSPDGASGSEDSTPR